MADIIDFKIHGDDIQLVAKRGRKLSARRREVGAQSTLWGLVALAALLSWPGPGQEVPFDVEPAYLEGEAIRFLPRIVDWESLVPEAIRNIPIPTADSAAVAEYGSLIDMFGGAELKSAVPLPEALAEQRHYFVDAQGLAELRLDSAHSVTRLDFNSRQTRIVGRQSWGQAYGTPSGRAAPSGGGFVVRSESSLSFDVMPTDFTPDDLLLGGDAARQTADGYYGQGEPFWEIFGQYGFTLEGERGEWVFVQWEPDRELFEAGCQYRYSLFRMNEDGVPPTQVSWTAYGCDV